MMVNPIEHNEVLKSQLLRAYEETDEQEAALERLLQNWAIWMTKGGTPFHVKSKSVGQGFTHYGETDYLGLDIANARTVNAVMGDLNNFERGAINVTYLGGRWIWLKISMDAELHQARVKLRAGCLRKGIL